jgi:hypothetical protein
MTSTQGKGPGWFPDPTDMHQLRYFDARWTDHVSDNGVQSVSPLPPAPHWTPATPAPPAVGSTAVGQAAPPVAWPTAGQAAYSQYGVLGPGVQGREQGPGMVGPGLIAPAAVSRAKATAPVLVLVGGVLMALGPLFAWETASASGGYVADVKGTSEGAGPVVLIAGLVAALLAVLVLTATTGRRKTGIATLVISAVGLVFVLGNYSSISKDIDSAPPGVTANIGIGLIFSVIGCALVVVASVGLIRNKASKA